MKEKNSIWIVFPTIHTPTATIEAIRNIAKRLSNRFSPLSNEECMKSPSLSFDIFAGVLLINMNL